MGYRATIIINVDETEQLLSDPDIGKKIRSAILHFTIDQTGDFGPLGCVVDLEHADIAKLVIIGNKGGFDAIQLSAMHISANSSDGDATEIELLTQAADKLGYRLTKKPKPIIHETIQGGPKK